ncbi:MAG TPA: DUF2461 domain-containing protein [Bacteroidota bacterium]|nr:DUF2461 domain-containing protein [Bacteroidota bacterium]
MKNLPIDADMFPPFKGFPKEGIAFLRQLKRNNNREWFESHKAVYEEEVKFPMQCLIASLHPYFESFGPAFDVNPKRSLFRIYRDIRFSKDKTPYKTHVAAHFVVRGTAKGTEGSGYYVHIEPGEIYVGGGIYMPDGDQLKKIRKAISERDDEFLSIVKNRKFAKLFGKIEGDALKRIPQGYEEGHPMSEWLKLKQFFVGVDWKEERCRKAGFVKDVADVFATASPLVEFLNEAARS